MSLPSGAQSLSANQISLTYLNWRLRYNYFRFWKTNVRHIGNLLSVSISTFCPKSGHYFASDYRMSSKSKHPLRKYDVISISQDGARDGWILLPVSYPLMSLPLEGQSLLASQILSRYLHWRLRYNYFRFRNTNVHHIGILVLICSPPLCRNLYVILHQATEFRPNWSTHCGNTSWRHIHFST